MKTKILFQKVLLLILLILAVITINLASLTSALIVDADYITIYLNEDGKITLEIENNENFDIEDISIALILDKVPFTSVGSSEKNINEIDEDDSDKITFTLRATRDIKPGDYNIPYEIKYVEKDENETIAKTGSFGLRVSAKTELDFAAETKGEKINTAIVGEKGKISLEIINRGLGEIKAVSMQIFPQGFELISKDKVFIGTIDSEDSDIVSFDVVFKSKNPTLSAKITYKDFDNNEQTEAVNLPLEIYTREQALEMGLITKNYTEIYIGIVVVLIIAWVIYRKIRKKQKSKNKIKGR